MTHPRADFNLGRTLLAQVEAMEKISCPTRMKRTSFAEPVSTLWLLPVLGTTAGYRRSSLGGFCRLDDHFHTMPRRFIIKNHSCPVLHGFATASF